MSLGLERFESNKKKIKTGRLANLNLANTPEAEAVLQAVKKLEDKSKK